MPRRISEKQIFTGLDAIGMHGVKMPRTPGAREGMKSAIILLAGITADNAQQYTDKVIQILAAEQHDKTREAHVRQADLRLGDFQKRHPEQDMSVFLEQLMYASSVAGLTRYSGSLVNLGLATAARHQPTGNPRNVDPSTVAMFDHAVDFMGRWRRMRDGWSAPDTLQTLKLAGELAGKKPRLISPECVDLCIDLLRAPVPAPYKSQTTYDQPHDHRAREGIQRRTEEVQALHAKAGGSLHDILVSVQGGHTRFNIDRLFTDRSRYALTQIDGVTRPIAQRVIGEILNTINCMGQPPLRLSGPHQPQPRPTSGPGQQPQQ